MEQFSAGRIYMIDAENIRPNPAQPRKFFEEEAIDRLAESISIYGILQPVTVRKRKAEHAPNADGRAGNISEIVRASYEIIAGERRLRAAKKLGIEKIPCIVMDADDRLSAELAIIENIQRENLNIFEQAGAIASLIDIYGLTQEQVARQLSSSQSYVANKLRILRLTAPEREVIISCSLTERHARALLKITDVKLRCETLAHIAEKQLNVAAAEEYIDKVIAPPAKPHNRPCKFILKDIRLFINTVDHAVELIRSAGIDITAERCDRDNEIELLINIKNERLNVSRET